MFSWKGQVPLSKSVLQRVLLSESLGSPARAESRPALGPDEALDARVADKAFRDFSRGSLEFWCEESATLLRFLGVRVTLEEGDFFLGGGPSLLARPMQDLEAWFLATGCRFTRTTHGYQVRACGWGALSASRDVPVPMEQTSQVASAVMICAAKRGELSRFKFREDLGPSRAYLELSRAVISGAGLEPDASAAFAVAAIAAVAGQATILGVSRESVQPDMMGFKVLSKMGVQVTWSNEGVTVQGGGGLLPAKVDLSSCPDLFPVLAAVCACADGVSVLYGAPHLRFKESDRIAGVERLLGGMHIGFIPREDGIEILGRGMLAKEAAPFVYDPASDHRLTMAAGVAKRAGYDLEVLNKNCVTKSFPRFWECALS